MSKMMLRVVSLLALLGFCEALAQTPPVAPRLAIGDGVITGFSGPLLPDPAKPRPAGKTVTDLTFINPDSPSARVTALGKPGHIWDGRLFNAPKTFDVLARDVGQVFGVALDDAALPNIYLAATSAFGLQLVDRARDGSTERRKLGGPGAGWMKGQFGLDLQGDPGSIYKVDGSTGVVSLFAKVTLNGVPNPGPALGNLAYDSANKQLLVSDLYTGMVHRFAIADGSELGVPFDHGGSARPAAGLPAVLFNPASRPNIANSQFNSENPDSWGYAASERRVWAVALHAGRVYYSVNNGAADPAQIWSVGLLQDGAFAGDARWELTVAAAPVAYPVSDIAFSQKGAMLLAQRARVAGSYDYSAFTQPGEPRVLRYWLKDRNDPPSPGMWKPEPGEYAIGFADTFRNTNGGIAFGYGYGKDGALSASACEYALWSTGQNLRNNPALQTQLAVGGKLLVHGIQGVPASPVRNFNEPPWVSYSVDYDDRFDDPRATGHMGSVRILTHPCAPVASYGGPGYAGRPPYVWGEGGTPGYADGASGVGGGGDVIILGCPPGVICLPPPCLYGTYPDGTCVPAPDLAIKKTAGEVKFDAATGVWTFQFTLSVTNNGIAFAPGNSIAIYDPVPTGVTFTSATGAGWTCFGSLNCGFNFGPGLFNNGASLPPLIVTATSNAPGIFTNCATVNLAAASGLQETELKNNKDCASVELKYPPNVVTVEKITPEEACAVEQPCTFKIKVSNSSPWPFMGVVNIGDNSSVPMSVLSTDLPCTPAPTALPFTCPAPVTLPAGPSSVTYTINANIPLGSIPKNTAQYENCASVADAPPLPGFPSTIIIAAPNCKKYSACGFACHMTQDQIDKVKIVKAADQTQCSPGGLCSYTFTISNLSTANTGNMPISFIDTMPPGASTYIAPPTPAPWTCLPYNGSPDQTKCLIRPSNIPPSGNITVTVTFQISPSYSQTTLKNCSEFYVGNDPPVNNLFRTSSPAMDEQAMRDYLISRGKGVAPGAALPGAAAAKPVLGADDKSCTTVNVPQPNPAPVALQNADVAIVKTGGTTPAPQVGAYAFYLAVTNVGAPFNGSNAIVVTDVVPAGMVFNSASGSGWSCATLPVAAGDTLTCTYTGAGPTSAGQSLGTINVNATALGSAPFPPVTNCGEVAIAPASGAQDTNAANDKSCVTITKPAPPVSLLPVVTPPVVIPPIILPPVPKPPVVINAQCQPPMVPGAVPGQCLCPQGTTLAGKECVPVVIAKSCTPPKRLRRGECVCPQGTVAQGDECVRPRQFCTPPKVQGASGECLCPAGTIARGKRCMEPLVCRGSTVLNQAGNGCVCKPGLVRRAGQCIEPAECRSPARPDGRGGCRCPQDSIKQGNSCVPRTRPQPRPRPEPRPQRPGITPGDIIQNLPGLIRPFQSDDDEPAPRPRPSVPRGNPRPPGY